MKRSLPILLALCFQYTPVYSYGVDSYTQADLNNEVVLAANWMQHSVEYRALVYQAFNIAADQLEEKLNLIPKGKKPALIVDIDDTLVEGTIFRSSMIGTNDTFSIERFTAWWSKGGSLQKALPGAVDFIHFAVQKGVEVFYISGRYENVLPETITTLKNNGFPNADADHIQLQATKAKILTKEQRRQHIQKQGYEVIMLLGDQLDDFADPPKLYNDRHTWVVERAQQFSKLWIMLPNPLYGTWIKALTTNYYKLSAVEQHAVHQEKLGPSLLNIHDPLLRQHIIQAALWQNTSAAFRALCFQAYNQAQRQLIRISKAININKEKPSPAIIIDIDDTILQISDELGILNIINNTPYLEKTLLRTDSTIISGAQEFLMTANKLGFEIFYMTNRPGSSTGNPGSEDIKKATIINLQKYNLPQVDYQHVITKHEFNTNKNNGCKLSRRSAIEQGKVTGKKHPIVMLVGDAMGDFDIKEQQLNPDLQDTADHVSALLGRRYILIPNTLKISKIIAMHKRAAQDKSIETMSPVELADLRLKLLKQWPEKPKF